MGGLPEDALELTPAKPPPARAAARGTRRGDDRRDRGRRRLEAALDDGFRLEAGGWKAERGTAITSTPETESFYREVADWAAGRGELRLWFMRVAGKPVAFAYCIEANARLYELKTGIDEELRPFAPGILLTRARLRHTFETKLESYEFLGAPASHKLQWTDNARDQVRVQGFPPGPGGAAGAALWKYGRPLAKRIAELPKRARRGAKDG